MLKDLILKNRSYRRFYERERLSAGQLEAWVDLARFSASGRNAQSLKYVLITDEEMCSQVFPLLSWAGYLKDWGGPKPEERPAAYLVMLNDKEISTNYYCDDGIAAQSILLGAVEAGYGGCIVASVKRSQLRDLLELDERFDIIQVLALGKPAETIVLDDMKEGDYKYWRDADDVHHVPKRPLSELILRK
ncbi:nitroreductase family protein [Gaoshiqia sp. Z1-71]|uniref:nitroreductase family protein n=1 Tax=Gaoshiqia hydrogeniformans TaxID=3290090 RepID=UPI003BF7E6DE